MSERAVQRASFRRRCPRPFAAVIAACVCSSLFVAASFANFNYPNFSSTASLNLVGAAAQSGAVLRITPSQPGRAGAAWHAAPQLVHPGFDTTFTFQLSELAYSGADGFAFVIQADNAVAIGPVGCGNGYQNLLASLAVEFDTWENSGCEIGTVGDPNGNHISVHSRGALPNSAAESASLGIATAVPDFSDGAVHTVRISYQSGVMAVFIDDLNSPVLAINVNLAALLGLTDGTAWVGFTGSTGGATENHDILSWSFTEIGTAPAGNHRPLVPVITEPDFDDEIVNPSDVHMETAPFADPDVGDMHLCTDWEIWTTSPPERVWHTLCIDGVERVHTHLGDGVFENSHAGRADLLASTDFHLRVRFRDDSGNAATEWSYWAQRSFRTADAESMLALELDDVASPPAPEWLDDAHQPIVLPAAAGPPFLRLEGPTGQLLLEVSGSSGGSNVVTNPAELDMHVPCRAHIFAGNGAGGLNLPPSTLRVSHDCHDVEVYLPAIALAPSQHAYFWIDDGGSTFVGDGGPFPSFMTLARAAPVPWVAREPGFAVEVFATGFQLPVNIAFIPNPGTQPNDPFFYVTELYGTIKLVTRDGTVSDYAAGLLNFNPTGSFPGSGEQGLAGICVDPASGDVFATILYDGPGSGEDHFPRVLRFHSTDGGRTAASQAVILDMVGEVQGQSHQISNISIGPDGKLYVHMGDGFDAPSAQNLDFFRGKVLRLNLDGTPPTDNPFYNAADGITARDHVFAFGLRNPFGGAWRAADSAHYSVENGPSVDRFAKIVAGRNYGWDGSDASMANFALYNWAPPGAPVNIAFIQSQTFGGSGFPVEKFDHAFVTESGPTWAAGRQVQGKRIVEFLLDANGGLVSGPNAFVEYVGMGRATAVALAAGPDGLYFSDLYKDQDYQSPIDRGSNILVVRRMSFPDCNHNGVSDLCEIAEGELPDANGNDTPDPCELLAGDMNCDGAVNNFDIDPFVLAIVDPAGYAVAFPSCDRLHGDVSGDGLFNNFDIDPFVQVLIGGP